MIFGRPRCGTDIPIRKVQGKGAGCKGQGLPRGEDPCRHAERRSIRVFGCGGGAMGRRCAGFSQGRGGKPLEGKVEVVEGGLVKAPRGCLPGVA